MESNAQFFLDGEFMGVAGGCGLLRDRAQVDAYLVHRTAGMKEEVVKNMSDDIKTIPPERLRPL